jgi:hypothetical protein
MKTGFTFANGDPMECGYISTVLDGKTYINFCKKTHLVDKKLDRFYYAEDVERKVGELEDVIRVTNGHANLTYTLVKFKEADIKKLKIKRCRRIYGDLVKRHKREIDDGSFRYEKAAFYCRWEKRWLEIIDKIKERK